ncbi:MAG: Prevent-host-death protein [Enterovirga sp.]|nr:Prevent-host-death protein [Enterovirga sp.]
MRSVGIKALKNKLSEYVRAAEAGETVLVTDRERVVAELVPPRRRSADMSVAAILEQGRQEGWYTPATRDRAAFVAALRARASPDDPGLPFEQIMADLARDREDR